MLADALSTTLFILGRGERRGAPQTPPRMRSPVDPDTPEKLTVRRHPRLGGTPPHRRRISYALATVVGCVSEK
jgi:hypothetical protein